MFLHILFFWRLFHFPHFFLFHGIYQCMLCFLSSIAEDEAHSTSAIFGLTFVDSIGFGIIFLSLKMNSTLPSHFILNFVNLVGLRVSFFSLKVKFIFPCHFLWTFVDLVGVKVAPFSLKTISIVSCHFLGFTL